MSFVMLGFGMNMELRTSTSHTLRRSCCRCRWRTLYQSAYQQSRPQTKPLRCTSVLATLMWACCHTQHHSTSVSTTQRQHQRRAERDERTSVSVCTHECETYRPDTGRRTSRETDTTCNSPLCVSDPPRLCGSSRPCRLGAARHQPRRRLWISCAL